MANSNIYVGFRYPSQIISHVVWLYFRFSLSFRDIEEWMASRGIIVTYETIRPWTLQCGQRYAPMRCAGASRSAETQGLLTRWC